MRLFVGGPVDGERRPVDDWLLQVKIPYICQIPDEPIKVATYRLITLIKRGPSEKQVHFFALEELYFEAAIALLVENYAAPSQAPVSYPLEAESKS